MYKVFIVKVHTLLTRVSIANMIILYAIKIRSKDTFYKSFMYNIV